MGKGKGEYLLNGFVLLYYKLIFTTECEQNWNWSQEPDTWKCFEENIILAGSSWIFTTFLFWLCVVSAQLMEYALLKRLHFADGQSAIYWAMTQKWVTTNFFAVVEYKFYDLIIYASSMVQKIAGLFPVVLYKFLVCQNTSPVFIVEYKVLLFAANPSSMVQNNANRVVYLNC